MMDLFLIALFVAAFMVPVFLTVSGRARKRVSVPLLVALIVISPVLISIAGMALYPYRPWTDTWVGSLIDAYFFGLVCFIMASPVFWYAYHHSSAFKTFGLAFAAAFDPRFNPNQRARGPVGKIAKSKILTGTKPPTGSRRFVAWRDRMLRDISGKGKH
jgi:hypothetical protein